MPSTCVFQFDRPEVVYYSGEIINGRILLTTTKEKSVTGIAILFEGIAKVRWEERKTERTRDGKSHTHTVQFRGDETYLNTTTYAMGAGTLPPGTHTYTICIPLPRECPTSCVGKYGKIHYELTLKLERSMRFDNKFVQQISVIHQLDLNLNPLYLWPINSEVIKHFCCWPCSSGPVISTLTIPFSAYAPGQEIPYSLQIDNQSAGYDVHGIELRLKQQFTFTAHTPHHKTRTHINTLAKVKKDERCLRLTKRILQGVLRIPGVPPTTETAGCIIDIAYHLDLSIVTDGCHVDTEMTVPITIGTVPLRQSATQPMHLVNAIEPSAPDSPGNRETDLPPSYDICKPPTFEEATQFDDNFDDKDLDSNVNRQIGWLPKYPMYNNFAEPSAPAVESENSNTAAQLDTAVESRPLMSFNNSNPLPYVQQNNSECPYPTSGVIPGMPQPM